MCSAHWFDEDRGLLAQGWYDQGVRFMDITNPRDIRQVGYWVTQGEFWGAYYSPLDKSVVYGLDVTSGIDVLKVDRAHATRTATIPVVDQDRIQATRTTANLAPSSRWGLACPLIKVAR